MMHYQLGILLVASLLWTQEKTSFYGNAKKINILITTEQSLVSMYTFNRQCWIQEKTLGRFFHSLCGVFPGERWLGKTFRSCKELGVFPRGFPMTSLTVISVCRMYVMSISNCNSCFVWFKTHVPNKANMNSFHSLECAKVITIFTLNVTKELI